MNYELISPPDYRHDTVLPLPVEVSADAWAVDAACSGNPGKVHALALMEQNGLRKTIYSDSFTAITWVRKMQCKTKIERSPKTEQLYNVIMRAETWLKTHPFRVPIIQWDTRAWGDIPADFGRK